MGTPIHARDSVKEFCTIRGTPSHVSCVTCVYTTRYRCFPLQVPGVYYTNNVFYTVFILIFKPPSLFKKKQHVQLVRSSNFIVFYTSTRGTHILFTFTSVVQLQTDIIKQEASCCWFSNMLSILIYCEQNLSTRVTSTAESPHAPSPACVHALPLDKIESIMIQLIPGGWMLTTYLSLLGKLL